MQLGTAQHIHTPQAEPALPPWAALPVPMAARTSSPQPLESSKADASNVGSFPVVLCAEVKFLCSFLPCYI